VRAARIRLRLHHGLGPSDFLESSSP
jgi:hypothetical protein